MNEYIEEVDPNLSKKFKITEEHFYENDDSPHDPASEQYRKAWSRNWDRNDNTQLNSLRELATKSNPELWDKPVTLLHEGKPDMMEKDNQERFQTYPPHDYDQVDLQQKWLEYLHADQSHVQKYYEAATKIAEQSQLPDLYRCDDMRLVTQFMTSRHE